MENPEIQNHNQNWNWNRNRNQNQTNKWMLQVGKYD